MNQEKHWNTIGKQYADEIFDVFANDKNQLLTKYFDKYANGNHTVIDFGCGIGKAFSYLSPRFKKVIGTDISGKLLKQASSQPYTNISLVKADLTKKDLHFEKADVAFCCNVIMLPEVDRNYAMLTNINKTLNSGGIALLVLPAMESMLYAAWRLIDWYSKDDVDIKDIPNNELNYFKGSKREIVRGNVHIDGVPTKHYTAEELAVILPEHGFELIKLERIEYDWSTEFSDPPVWMQAPYPWDWLVVCKKRS